MRFTFLGTSAANAFPEPFCHCENCQNARLLGGKSLRKRSSGLINDDLLIDFGPDVLTAANMYGISFDNLNYCLQTHGHADHLDVTHFFSRSPEFGVIGASILHFYASGATLNYAAKMLERDCLPGNFLDLKTQERLNVSLHPIKALKPFQCGPYTVTPIPANHDAEMQPLLFAIEEDNVCVFYGADTASLSEHGWKAFHDLHLRFDLVILDHTYGPDQPGSDHLSAHQVGEHTRRMREEGLLKPNARIFATHIAHEGNPYHEKLVEFGEKHGYEIAFDGLSIDI